MTKRPLCPHRDPITFANRPLEKSFDAYLSLREHLSKLVIAVRVRKKPA